MRVESKDLTRGVHKRSRVPNPADLQGRSKVNPQDDTSKGDLQ
jgi:hypothetical protein